ncbi:MAG: hypothetical protein J6Y26_02790 [Lachnospiraceae bacterium]|nr:hypothetical protein [Lachnospiraceae bacterium]
MATKVITLDDLCPFCGSECKLERSTISPASHIFCTNYMKCGADFWFYGVEKDPLEQMKRFRRRCVQ